MMKKNNAAACYLFGAGETRELIWMPGEKDYVIAVDGGYETACAKNISVDLVIGDFDSLEMTPVHENIITLETAKDDTDMLAALREGLALGHQTFYLYGGMGGRIDHTLANIQCLAFLAAQNARGYLIGEDYILTVFTNDSVFFSAEEKGNISVLCYGEKAEGVFIKGLAYTLEGATLENTFPIGVSNAFIGQKSVVGVEDGTLLVAWQYK
jgi:thiamine pyrophosphokinase